MIPLLSSSTHAGPMLKCLSDALAMDITRIGEGQARAGNVSDDNDWGRGLRGANSIGSMPVGSTTSIRYRFADTSAVHDDKVCTTSSRVRKWHPFRLRFLMLGKSQFVPRISSARISSSVKSNWASEMRSVLRFEKLERKPVGRNRWSQK